MIGLSVLQYYPQYDYMRPEEHPELCTLVSERLMPRYERSAYFESSAEELIDELCTNIISSSVGQKGWIYKAMEVEKLENPELVTISIYKYLLFRLVNFIYGEEIVSRNTVLVPKMSVSNKNIAYVYFSLYKRYYHKLSEDAKLNIHNLQVPGSWKTLENYNAFIKNIFVPTDYVRCHPDFYVDHQQRLYPAEITSQFANMMWYNDPASGMVIENESNIDDYTLLSDEIMIEEAFKFMGMDDELEEYELDEE